MSDPAIIGWDSIGRLPTTTITASAEIPAWPARAAANELTWEGWRLQPDGFGAFWLRMQTPAPVTCDYFALVHNFATVEAIVSCQRWDGAAWETVSTVTCEDDAPVLAAFTAATSDDWRILLAAGPGAPPPPAGYLPTLSVAFIGSRLDMPTSIYGGHSPAALSPDAIVEPHHSERGEFLGRSVIRTGETGSYEWKHLDPAWYRANFAPFVRYAMEGRGAFFIKWRPNKYDETIYGWSEGRIRPSNMGIGPGLMEVSVNVRGIAQPGMRY